MKPTEKLWFVHWKPQCNSGFTSQSPCSMHTKPGPIKSFILKTSFNYSCDWYVQSSGNVNTVKLVLGPSELCNDIVHFH